MENRNIRRNLGGFSNSVSALSGYSNRAGWGNSAISRGSFIKGAGAVVGTVAAAGLGLGGTVSAQIVPTEPTSCEVYPTGNAFDDTTNVQAAVSYFDIVILKSHKLGADPSIKTAFHFGTNSIYFIKNVAVSGEITKDTAGNVLQWHTKINGGGGKCFHNCCPSQYHNREPLF